jgi:hypothetical protein
VDSVGVPRDPTYSGTLREVVRCRVRDCHPLWSAFPSGSAGNHFLTPMWKALQPRRGKPPRFGLVPVRSPLLGKSIFLSFPAVTEMFQFAAFATRAYVFSTRGFRDPGIIARLSTPPGISQTSTPFKAS